MCEEFRIDKVRRLAYADLTEVSMIYITDAYIVEGSVVIEGEAFDDPEVYTEFPLTTHLGPVRMRLAGEIGLETYRRLVYSFPFVFYSALVGPQILVGTRILAVKENDDLTLLAYNRDAYAHRANNTMAVPC